MKSRDDKKELRNPPRVQEKELKEPEKISLRVTLIQVWHVGVCK
jgi:hypothetical protein